MGRGRNCRPRPRDSKGWFFLFTLAHEHVVREPFPPHYNVTSKHEVTVVIRNDGGKEGIEEKN